MSEELKKCPFCGADPDISVQEDDTEDTYYVVACTNCNMAHSSSDDEDVAIRNWNDRPIEDAQAARIAELEAERDRMREALQVIASGHFSGRVELVNTEEMKTVWKSNVGLPMTVSEARDIARKALKGAGNVEKDS